MDFGMPYLIETATVEDAAALCRELGLKFVELNRNFPACQAINAEELCELKEQYGIYFTLHIEEECDPFAFNKRVRQAWRESVLDSLSLAKAAKMPLLNMHMPHGVYITLPDRKAILYEQYFDQYAADVLSFRSLCEEALRDTGIRIGIENTDGFYPNEIKAVEMLLESPVFGLTLDIGHSHGVGNKDIPLYEKHFERLIHMHGHDGLGRKNHLALGDGEIDLRGRFAWASRNQTRVVLETKTVAALRTSVERLGEYLPDERENM